MIHQACVRFKQVLRRLCSVSKSVEGQEVSDEAMNRNETLLNISILEEKSGLKIPIKARRTHTETVKRSGGVF